MTKFSDLVGLTLTRAEKVADDRVEFETDNGRVFALHHYEDCCEHVSVEDIAGDLSDLVGAPIALAEENSNSDDPKRGEYDESWTWTFYRIATANGLVVIRWYGTSNGYYSESVSFDEVSPAHG